MAPLLPKLRGHFAEFLNNASPVGLRILSSSPVSVYGTGTLQTIAAFLGSQLTRFATMLSLRITSSDCVPGFPNTLLPRLHRSLHSRLALSFCVPTVLLYSSTGISTCYPSTTSFDLALGPDLPRADQLYPGNLGYSAEGFPPSSRYSFRHSLFHTVHSSFRYCFFLYAMLLYRSALADP